MTRKGKAITLSLAEHHKARLEQLAQEFKMTWGENPNISKLLKAIAEGKLALTKNFGWSHDRLETLNRILNHLKDQGDIPGALELAQLLVERSEISEPLRQEIQSWLSHPKTAWRRQLERCIHLHQPFQLQYQDAADRPWCFTVRYAVIQRHEDRDYLDCWCEEIEGNQDIAPLHHNWSLRLDRIPEESAITPVDRRWQLERPFILVELQFLRGLALGYHPKKPDDQLIEWLPNQSVKRVVRRVYNTFWFLREIRRYGPDCVIISPVDVQDLYVKTLRETLEHYENNENDERSPGHLSSFS